VSEPGAQWDAEASGTTDCATSANLRLHDMRPLATARHGGSTRRMAVDTFSELVAAFHILERGTL
jgi:hypothetical protein